MLQVKDPKVSKGYSFPVSDHKMLAEEAAKRGDNASNLLRKAMRWYIRTFPAGTSEPPTTGL